MERTEGDELNETEKRDLALHNVKELQGVMKEIQAKELELPEGIRINLGCGLDRRSGFINLDRNGLLQPDIIHDLEMQPWPFADNSAAEILAKHVLEHLIKQGDHTGFFNFFRECYRILKTGGIVKVHVPSYRFENAFGDPGHKSAYSRKTFLFLSKKAYDFNREHKTTMTQYPIDFDFDIICNQEYLDEINIILKKV